MYVRDDKIEIKLTQPLEHDITPGVFLKVMIERENEQNNYEFEVIISFLIPPVDHSFVLCMPHGFLSR